MTDSNASDVLQKVRKALGRAETSKSVPPPPTIDESIVRLVSHDADLVQTFIRTSTEAKFKLHEVAESEASGTIVRSIQLQQCKRVGIPKSPLLDRLKLPEALASAGLHVERWDLFSLDSAYDLECGISDVFAAVAETGSLVIRPSAAHGRALSLVPPLHIAVVERCQIIADLIDLFAKLGQEARSPNTTIITGPSKTADIEGSLVTGVHGPGIVEIYLLR